MAIYKEQDIEPYFERGQEGAATKEYSEGTITPNDVDVEQVQIETKSVDVPPNGGYGWICVACVFLINAHTWGINSVGKPLLLFECKLIFKVLWYISGSLPAT